MNIKKPFFHHNLYIEPTGLTWVGLSSGGGREGHQLAYKESISFSKLLSARGGLGLAPTAGPLHAMHEPGFILEWFKKPELKEALTELLERLPLKRSVATLCFSEAFSVFRFFTMPRVGKVYRRKAVPIEARKHIPFPLEDCVYDWKAQEVEIEGKPLLGVYFAAMKRDIFEAASQLCLQVGIQPAFVEAAPMAASRAAERFVGAQLPGVSFSQETILVVYLDQEQVQLSLFSKAIPVLSRSVYLTDAAVRGNFILERRKLDLEATLSFVRRQLGIEHADRLILFGAIGIDKESLNNWASGLSEEVGLKVDVLSAAAMNIPAPDNKSEVLASWGEMIGFGAALRGVSHTLDSYELDLMVPFSEEPPQKVGLRKIWRVATAVGLVLGGLSLWRYFEMAHLKNNLAGLRQGGGSLPAELQGKNAAAIKIAVTEQAAKIAALRSSADPQNRAYLTPIIEELAQKIPRDMWLEGVTFRSGVGAADAGSYAGGASQAQLTCRGRVYTSDGQKDFALINTFFKLIKEHSMISAYFPKADVSVRKDERETNSFRASAGGSVSRATLSFVMGFGTKSGGD